jgi:photosystem II stability/assembly factor-like uncharacterized protein
MEHHPMTKLLSKRSTRILVGLAALACLALAGCAPVPPSGGIVTPGHWEVVRQIDYDALPKTALKGYIGPAYLYYAVSLAGFHTDAFGVTVGPDDDVRYTTDGGASWTKSPNALFCRHGLEIVDDQVAWHCGNGGTRVSTDGGRTWRTVAPSACPSLSFLDARTGWAASVYRLQATADGGATWSEVARPPAMDDIAAVALRTAADGTVLDKKGALYITADGGTSWRVLSLGLKAGEQLMSGQMPMAVMRFFDARRGLVVFDLSDGTVWSALTLDGGQTWQRAEIPELRGRSTYYHLYLARDGRLLTATDDFQGRHASVVLRYQQP